MMKVESNAELCQFEAACQQLFGPFTPLSYLDYNRIFDIIKAKATGPLNV